MSKSPSEERIIHFDARNDEFLKNNIGLERKVEEMSLW
jgi:hypothetical protein